MAATAKDHLDVGGKIAWLSSLDTAYQPEKNYRRSSIICTIGPKTNSVEAINALRKAGLNVVRMNFSVSSPNPNTDAKRQPPPKSAYLANPSLLNSTAATSTTSPSLTMPAPPRRPSPAVRLPLPSIPRVPRSVPETQRTMRISPSPPARS